MFEEKIIDIMIIIDVNVKNIMFLYIFLAKKLFYFQTAIVRINYQNSDKIYDHISAIYVSGGNQEKD